MSVTTVAGGLGPLNPPLADDPLDKGGRFTEAWTRHQQDLVDAINSVRTGVVDGSSAAAGEIGEYIEATISTPVGLAGAGTAANVGSISLTAGDWEVSGSVVFTSSAANLITVLAWLSATSGVLADPGASGIATNVGTTRLGTGTRLLTGPVRFNLTATTTIYLGVSAAFPAGTASVTGHLGARRMR
jgi:hypothetical protein